MKELATLWKKLPDSIKRIIHTFYQAFLAVFLVGASPIATDVLHHSYADAKIALVALCSAALAAGFSAIKGLLISLLETPPSA